MSGPRLRPFAGRGLNGRGADLGDSGAQEAAHEWTVEIIVVADADVADELSGALENAVGIGEQCASVETQVHMIGIGDNVAEAIFERLAGKRESDSDCITVDKGFEGFGGFFENNLAKREREIGDLRIIGREIGEKFAFGRSGHVREDSMTFTDFEGGRQVKISQSSSVA